MILTGTEIIKAVEKGDIIIRPFSIDQVNPNSYNFRLGTEIKYYEDEILDPKVKPRVVSEQIGESGFLITPEKLFLGHTMEIMGSTKYVPIIKGRSSTARMGLFIHVTANLIDIGSINQWTLQMHAVEPIIVYKNMEIGQVTFWKVQGEIKLYNGKYQGAQGPVESMVYKDFK